MIEAIQVAIRICRDVEINFLSANALLFEFQRVEGADAFVSEISTISGRFRIAQVGKQVFLNLA